ncbi:MAG: hypothetical protein WB816_14350, partial [Methylocystis sp.]
DARLRQQLRRALARADQSREFLAILRAQRLKMNMRVGFYDGERLPAESDIVLGLALSEQPGALSGRPRSVAERCARS